MKNLIWLFLIFACNTVSSEYSGLEGSEMNKILLDQKNKLRVSGKLLNFLKTEDSDLQIQYVCVIPTKKGNEMKTTSINSNGEFEIEIEFGIPYQEIWLTIGDYFYTGILVKNDLELILDLSILKIQNVRYNGPGITFKGPDADMNMFINNYYNFEKKKRASVKRKKTKLMINHEISLKAKIDSIFIFYDELYKIINDYSNDDIDKFKWILLNNHFSDLFGDLFVLHWGQEMEGKLLEKCLLHKPKVISNASVAYYSNLETYLSTPTPNEYLEIVSTLLLQNSVDEEKLELNKFLNEFNKRINWKQYDKDVYSSGEKKFLKKNKNRLNTANLDLFLKKAGNLNSSKASIVKLFGVPEDLNKRKSYVEKVLPTINSEWVQNILKRNLEADNSRLKDLSNLLKIQSVTDSISSIGKYIATLNDSTIFFESNHDKILHLINSIRKRNNGQMIILDVWATWCSPCINDMLESKEKKILLNKKGVKVVYLCVQNGSSIENWKMKVAETSAFGDHIFLNNKLSSELMELFKLSGYPSYIVIDKEGKYYPDLINSISQIDISKIDEILH